MKKTAPQRVRSESSGSVSFLVPAFHILRIEDEESEEQYEARYEQQQAEDEGDRQAEGHRFVHDARIDVDVRIQYIRQLADAVSVKCKAELQHDHDERKAEVPLLPDQEDRDDHR